MTRSPEPTANLVSEGDHRTNVAARLIRRRTRVGLYPVGEGSQTRAFRSIKYQHPRWKGARSRGLRRDRTLRARHNAATVRGNINTGDRLVMALQHICQLESISSLAVQLNRRVSGNSQSCMVGRERVVGNGVVEKVVNFGSSHFCGSWCDRSSSLLSPRKSRDYTG